MRTRSMSNGISNRVVVEGSSESAKVGCGFLVVPYYPAQKDV